MEPSLTSNHLKKASDLFKTLGDKTRVSILYLLRKKECNVTEISSYLNMEQSAVSHQLKVLRNARLVKYRKEGKSVYYQLNDDHVYEIIHQVMEHIGEEDE